MDPSFGSHKDEDEGQKIEDNLDFWMADVSEEEAIALDRGQSFMLYRLLNVQIWQREKITIDLEI